MSGCDHRHPVHHAPVVDTRLARHVWPEYDDLIEV
ncbi:hypothetical protein SPV1_08526 [Mariprofundus ferrooxydans PV-1]|uniref:Uncharacterized protein n=1 Tax=Mariprofundus ferrooxydans PV-1 TaxID=314345 RepID=Q0EYV8_9PROT|nr:hypothetical protein SPV1_08526 [Mariprofundus ferrooxydans PV-1]